MTHLRAAGVVVEVVSPASFPHHGIAYGHGIAGNLRQRPWLAAFIPAFLLQFRRAAKPAVARADLVHAHWLGAGAVAATLRKPFVLQVWGTDLELARYVPWLARRVLSRAEFVIAASTSLAAQARRLGARDVRVIAGGVEFPPSVSPPETPPHALYVGRLSTEKGVLDLAEAAADLPVVFVGDGPLRGRVPQALGFVPHAELGRYYERAAIVVAPSRREGYGVAVREAMAYGRPVVVTSVGGLSDAVDDGVTGLIVPPRDPAALRAALERLLADQALRQRLGDAAREHARAAFAWPSAVAATLEIYREGISRGGRAQDGR